MYGSSPPFWIIITNYVEYSVMNYNIFNQSLNTPIIEKYLFCQNVE